MEETFTIDNDKAADWAISKIHDAEDERDRLITLAEEEIKDLTMRIEELKVKCDNETSYLKSLLSQYFNTVKTKETKTQKSYKLLSGTLVLKKATTKINHDDDKLIEYLEGTQFVKIAKKVDWAEFKKDLIVLDGKVVDTITGDIVEACTVEDVPESFSIKF